MTDPPPMSWQTMVTAIAVFAQKKDWRRARETLLFVRPHLLDRGAILDAALDALQCGKMEGLDKLDPTSLIVAKAFIRRATEEAPR